MDHSSVAELRASFAQPESLPITPPMPPKKSKRPWLILAIAAPLLVIGTWVVASNVKDRGAKERWPTQAPGAESDAASVLVTTTPVAFQPVQRTIEAVGTLHGYEEIQLAARVDGRVLQILHDVGDRIKPGELLVEVDPVDYDLAMRQAEKALQVELAKLGLNAAPAKEFDVNNVPSVQQATIRLENARRRLARMETIKGSASNEELNDRKAEFQMAEAELSNNVLLTRSTLATVLMKLEALAMAKQQLKDTKLVVPTPRKPIPGAGKDVEYAVTSRSVSEGTALRPGMEVCRLIIDQTLKLRVSVPERFSSQVASGQKVDVYTAAYAKPFPGTVTRVNPAVDVATRTFEVEIEVPNSEHRMKAGGFAKAAIHTRVDDDTPTVPLEAIVSFAGITKIFVLENGKAREVQVTLGVQTTKWVEIAQPEMQQGTVVITSGQTALANGTPVKARAER
jgi:multidrug efflux pump subunit AcrA (membrane-fusion protein)